tara:strand:- start:58 stop:489 length:432 start_codon:yes stop_codon:yes gene_type:complete
MITFEVSDKSTMKIIEYDNNETLISLKKHIINEFKLDCKYIDLDFKNETTLRGMGKFNLDPGVILRTFDNYKLDRWNLENKVLRCELIEINDYEPENRLPIIKKASSNIYRPQSKFAEIKSGDEYIEEPTYSLDSKEDFPTLS